MSDVFLDALSCEGGVEHETIARKGNEIFIGHYKLCLFTSVVAIILVTEINYTLLLLDICLTG